MASKFSELIQGEKPVLVDFTATWCGPCKIMSPILDDVKQKMGDSITIIKIDIDKNPAVTSALHVSGVPTLILFKNGQAKWRQSGVTPASQLVNLLEQYV